MAYFSNLFAISCPSCPSHLQDLIQPAISEENNTNLCTIPELEEIRNAVFTMGNYKSPGPNSMTATFYKQYWAIFGDTVASEVKLFFQYGSLNKAFNHIHRLDTKNQGSSPGGPISPNCAMQRHLEDYH